MNVYKWGGGKAPLILYVSLYWREMNGEAQAMTVMETYGQSAIQSTEGTDLLSKENVTS